MSLHGVAPDRVYSDGRLARRRVSSYLTFPPLPLQLSCNGKGGKAIPSELHPLRRGDRTRKAGLAGPLSHYPPRGAQRRMALTSTVQLQWRYISVALFLGSPPAGVTRYPCPAEPGLSSRTAFRLVPAAVRLTRPTILHILPRYVKRCGDLFSCNRVKWAV